MPKDIQNLVIYNLIDILEKQQEIIKAREHELQLIKTNLNIEELQLNVDIANANKDIKDCYLAVEFLYALLKAKSENNDEQLLTLVKDFLTI